MEEEEEITGVNGGSPGQMIGGSPVEINGMSSINGLQIMNTFSLNQEKSNGLNIPNEKVFVYKSELYVVNLAIKD